VSKTTIVLLLILAAILIAGIGDSPSL